MKFQSTRGGSPPVGFRDAFAAGLAPDGGLYVPGDLPRLPEALLDPARDLPYPDLAFAFLRLFDTDHAPDELEALVRGAHEAFEDPADAAPLRRLDDRLFVLELFHGPTLAFKDFGLQLVGRLFEDQIRRTGRPIHVLGATSGDTGSAAIHGLAGRAGARVFILYPEGRISPLQERQMTCTGADNVFPIPIEGSFDDAQRIVKDLFGDLAFKERVGLSAINSINLARILAQSVYYLHAWRRLPEPDGPSPEFVVPTGNFGNVFAGWLAHRMGMPARRFVVATNRNDILHRLFTTGRYQPGAVAPSLAPSMDIQVASNFERFLFEHLGRDAARTTEAMRRIRDGAGTLEVPGLADGTFTATRTDDETILARIREVHERFGYLVDPHTACGFESGDPGAPTIVLATAHPAKFPDTIERAIGERPTHPALEALAGRTPVRYELPADAATVRDFILAHEAPA